MCICVSVFSFNVWIFLQGNSLTLLKLISYSLECINQLINYSDTRVKVLPKSIFYKMKSSVVKRKGKEDSGSCSAPMLVMKTEEQSDNEEDTLAP